MKIIQIIPLNIVKKQAQNDWTYKNSFWEGIALSLFKSKRIGQVILYTDQEGIDTLIDQLGLPYDEVHLIENEENCLSDCIIDILCKHEDCTWVSTDLYCLSDLNLIEKDTLYFWNQELPEMVSTSRIYRNNEKVKSLFSKPHNWGGYHIFDGIFNFSQQFWQNYKAFYDSLIIDNEIVNAKNQQNYDKFKLRYFLSVYAHKFEHKFSENLDFIAKNNFSFENIIQALPVDLPFIYASETLKYSENFADLISYLLFEESPETFYKIQNVHPFIEKDFFLRTTECSKIIIHSFGRSLWEKDSQKFEAKRERFFWKTKSKVYTRLSYESFNFLSTNSFSDIMKSKWQIKNNNTLIESNWKWDMKNFEGIDRATYTKLKVIFNKTELSGHFHTCIFVNSLTKRIREENMDILEMLILNYLRTPKKVIHVINLIASAIFEEEKPQDFSEKCITIMKTLTVNNYIEKI
jgi:hypothetical protein